MRQYSARNDKTIVSGLQALFHSIWSNRLFFSTVFALVLVAFTSVSAQEETAQVPLSVENVTQWDWFKGLRAPSSDWNEAGFSASSNSDWLQGTTPFGYNEFFIRVNHGTLIRDMQNSYNSIYLRLEFEVESPERAVSLDFSVSHDAGIVHIAGFHATRCLVATELPTQDMNGVANIKALATITVGTTNEFGWRRRNESKSKILRVQVAKNQIRSSDGRVVHRESQNVAPGKQHILKGLAFERHREG